MCQVTNDIHSYLQKLDPNTCLVDQDLTKINLLDKLLAHVRAHLSQYALGLLNDIKENSRLKAMYEKIEAIYNCIDWPSDADHVTAQRFQGIKDYILLFLLENAVQIDQTEGMEQNERFKKIEDFLEQLYSALTSGNLAHPLQLRLVFTNGQQQVSIEGLGENDPTSRNERFSEAMRNDYNGLIERLKKHGIKLPQQHSDQPPISPDDYAYIISVNSGENFREGSLMNVRIVASPSQIPETDNLSIIQQIGRGAIFIEPDFKNSKPVKFYYHPNKLIWMHEFLHVVANAKGESRRAFIKNYSSRELTPRQIPLLNAYYIGVGERGDTPSAEEFCITIGLNISEKVLAESLGFNHTRGIYSGVYLSMANIEIDIEAKRNVRPIQTTETPVQLLNRQLERGMTLPTRQDAINAAESNRLAEQPRAAPSCFQGLKRRLGFH